MLIYSLHTFGDSSSAIGALGFSASSFVIQLITFILAYLILRRRAFGPILKVLKERRDTIAKGVSLGEEMQKERIALDDKIKSELQSARAKADKVLADAEEAARDAIRQSESKAQEKADAILEEAKLRTKQDIDRAKRKLEHEIAVLVADATEVLTGEKVDSVKDAKLINKALTSQQVES